MKTKVLFLFGTRPEAIKLCPVIHHLQAHPDEFDTRVCVTAQHRQMLDQVLEVFAIVPQHDLNLMEPGQSLYESTARIVAGLEPVLETERPDLVLVQGDTTTTFCAALAAFYRHTPVGHVEAGLRTWDIYQPFPEEMNRLLAGRIATLHFAATSWAAANLRREGVPDDRVFITGNTGIDTLLHVARRLETGELRGIDWPSIDPTKKLILVTAHRRESFGEGIANLCTALRQLARRDDVHIVYPVHPNPNVREPVERRLASVANVTLTEPLPYVAFVDLMRRSHLLLTDSGGIQEEGPSLGKPVLVLRNKTERPEAVEAGTVRLVGTDVGRIVSGVTELIENRPLWERMSAIHNPYGDGGASARIAGVIRSFQSKNSQ